MPSKESAMIGDKIRLKREELNLTQEELAKKMGYKSKSTINKIEMGINDITQSKIVAFAKALDTTPSYLMGWEDPIQEKPTSKAHRINVYGKIPAGVPLEAIEDIIDWEEIPASWQGDYIALQVEGNSMEPEYREGDVIIVKLQPDCESGQDCVVYVNGFDATLKRVVKQNEGIMLQPLNPAYEPRIYGYTDEDGVTILGVVVEMRRKKV